MSFARHPTNGMSAFKFIFDTPPVFPVILHDPFFLFIFFVGKRLLIFWGFDVWLR